MRTIGWIITLIAWSTIELCAGERLQLHQVTKNVYAIVGELGNRSSQNLGNNATFGFVITPKGVVLIDSGGSYKGAQAIDAVIKSVTDQPVVTVINTGGQDHRWFGNGYFKEKGAKIIATQAAHKDHETRFGEQMVRLQMLAGDKAVEGTKAVYADRTFASELTFTLGGTPFKLYHEGMAHTPGDAFVYLPNEGVMFSGDIVYVTRMLGIMSHSNSKSWINTYQKMASFKPKHLVPGHGAPTNMKRAERDTYDYLHYLRDAVATFMEEGGEIGNVGTIDQSKFNYLKNHDTLSGRNAQQVYSEMEWE
jgi:glyoxylase-like metal-dependent hydrolase (beta-lactamase superfamily II)